jgi:hypothetical protein
MRTLLFILTAVASLLAIAPAATPALPAGVIVSSSRDTATAANCASFSQAVTWQKVEAHGAVPLARSDAALAYDGDRNRLLLFGGRNGSAVLSDTWSFDLLARRWQALAIGNMAHPPARFSMVAGVDRLRQRLLITSGQAGTGQFFDDIWSFDLTDDTWTEVAIHGDVPPARYGSAGGIAVVDGAALFLSHGFTDQGRFDDTWAFNLATDTWQDVTPSDPAPFKRCLHSSAAIGPDTLVIFGGCASGFGPCPLGDTWQFDRQAGTWTQIGVQSGPSARLFAAMAPVGDCGAILLFGGQGESDLNDLWQLDAATGAWTSLQVAGAQPSARHGHSMVWADSFGEDLGQGAALVFGGQSAGADLNDLWVLVAGVGDHGADALYLPLVASAK